MEPNAMKLAIDLIITTSCFAIWWHVARMVAFAWRNR